MPKKKKSRKIKHLMVYESRGKEYVYVRIRKGKKLHRHPKSIEEPIGSEAFMQSYLQRLRDLRSTVEAVATGQVMRGSLVWIFQQYKQSKVGVKPWSSLAEGTQKGRAGRLEGIMKSLDENGIPWGHRTELNHKDILEIQKAKADFPEAANNRVKDLSAMFQWAISAKITREDFVNPCIDPRTGKRIAKIGQEVAGHREAWTLEEIEQFKRVWPLGTMQHLAVTLIQYTGARVSDAFCLGSQHIKKNYLEFIPQKTKRRSNAKGRPTYVTLPIHNKLRESINAVKTGGSVVSLTFVTNSNGKPFKTEKVFSQWLVRARKQANLPDYLTPHGLRASAATFLAEAGASEKQMCAVLGWKNPNSARTYIQNASQKKLATDGINMLDENIV
jgi:integrase